MRIAITGASGLVGTALVQKLQSEGHSIVRIVRRATGGEDEIPWNPSAGQLEGKALEGLDGVIHLAGENIAAGRWTAALKARIRDSRIQGTTLLASRLAALESPPKFFISASAVGYYGNRGDERLSESSPPGEGFLPEVCVAWENATQPASERGIRTALVRIGVVLTPKGGALSKMLLPFKLGLGGVVGPGTQFMSWIGLADLVDVFRTLVVDDRLQGPFNGVSPNPVTNRTFTRTLGRVLGRPTIFPMPAFAARLVMGEMADKLLLASTRVEPVRLLESGHVFQFPELEASLRHELNR